MTELVVCDAGPLIHLDQLGCLDLLSDFPSLMVPDVVWNEVLKYRPRMLPQAFATLVAAPSAPDTKVSALCRAFSLDAGEAACLAMLAGSGSAIFLTMTQPRASWRRRWASKFTAPSGCSSEAFGGESELLLKFFDCSTISRASPPFSSRGISSRTSSVSFVKNGAWGNSPAGAVRELIS